MTEIFCGVVLVTGEVIQSATRRAIEFSEEAFLTTGDVACQRIFLRPSTFAGRTQFAFNTTPPSTAGHRGRRLTLTP